jgi:hypothetical protein
VLTVPAGQLLNSLRGSKTEEAIDKAASTCHNFATRMSSFFSAVDAEFEPIRVEDRRTSRLRD